MMDFLDTYIIVIYMFIFFWRGGEGGRSFEWYRKMGWAVGAIGHCVEREEGWDGQ